MKKFLISLVLITLIFNSCNHYTVSDTTNNQEERDIQENTEPFENSESVLAKDIVHEEEFQRETIPAPLLQRSGSSLEDFIPDNWVVKLTNTDYSPKGWQLALSNKDTLTDSWAMLAPNKDESYDINGDGINDIVAVIEHERNNPGYFSNEYNSNWVEAPRILFVAFGTSDENYRLALQNNNVLSDSLLYLQFGGAVSFVVSENNIHVYASSGSARQGYIQHIITYKNDGWCVTGYEYVGFGFSGNIVFHTIYDYNNHIFAEYHSDENMDFENRNARYVNIGNSPNIENFAFNSQFKYDGDISKVESYTNQISDNNEDFFTYQDFLEIYHSFINSNNLND